MFSWILLVALVAPGKVPQVSESALTYLNQALDLMQQNSINKKTVDWPSLRETTIRYAAGAKNAVDTYGAIRFALQRLNDHHSFLQLSPELQAKEKNKAVPDAQGEEWPPSPYISRHSPRGTLHLVDGLQVATLVVPAFKQSDDGAMHAYADKLQKAMADLANEKPAGWIIDLRGNLGGNMWPMLAGLGSLAGDGPLGFFIDADGKKETWFYASDGSGVLTHDGKRQILCWTPPPRKVHFRAPQIVAVLIDRGTASSGEAIAIAFEGRPLSRSFGRHTHGQSTSNQGFALPDGAKIVLTTGLEADRTGHVYPDGITPDAELPKETKLAPPGSVDPMTLAAAAWIKTMASSR